MQAVITMNPKLSMPESQKPNMPGQGKPLYNKQFD